MIENKIYFSPCQAHKKQVEITQEGLQQAKQKYSLALKNLEGISEEIHEMRKSRDSLDTILHEREEGVGAESPVGDLSRDGIRPEREFNFKELGGRSYQQKERPCYGFKIALVSASSQAQTSKVVAFDQAESGMPVGERDGDPEGCSSVDEQQLGVATRHQDLSKREESELDPVICQGENNSATLHDNTEAIDTQGAPLFDDKDQQHIAQQATDPVSNIAEDEMCSATERTSCDSANKNDLELLVEDPTNKTTDNCETCNDDVEKETTASETPTELQSEVSIVLVADNTANEDATRVIVDSADFDSMEEAAKQQVLNEDIADESSELLEQERSIPSHRVTVEEGRETEILPSSDVESSSHLTEDCAIATPSC